MHSKKGKQTINQYICFRDINRKLPGIKPGERQRKMLEQLGFVPETLEEELKQAGLTLNIPNLL